MVKIVLPDSDEKLLKLCDVAAYRASGAGGQHVNTTDSAVRLTLRGYNITVTCQQERSQHQNKMICLAKLRSKVEKLNYIPPKRIQTCIPRTIKRKNLEKKARHSLKKKLRSPYFPEGQE